MIDGNFTYAHEIAAHDQKIEILNREAFGPSRYTRAAHLIREGGPHALDLSFVAIDGNEVIATLRQTPIAIGTYRTALLLGPIVVSPIYKNAGIGAKLMNMALTAAEQADYHLVVLVGDEPYYRRFRFKQIEEGKIHMPAPVNPARLLASELTAGALEMANGKVRHLRCLG